MRPPVAVLVSRFPLVTETFILREIEELERQGQAVRLVPLIRARAATVHAEAVRWLRRALYTPWLSPAVLAGNARVLRRRPRRYLRVLGRVLLGTVVAPGVFARSLALFPKCVFLAERLEQEGIGHLHAHFATYPALAAFVISSLTGIPFSVTVHAHDIFVRRTMLRAKLEAASFVRVISRFNRDFLVRRYPGLARKLRVIHTGVEVQRYASCGPPPPGTAALLCVAALKPYKGLPVLVEACRRLRDMGVDFHCDLVGEGPERAKLERAIAAAGLRAHVRLLGARPQHEVAHLLAGASLVVLPSVVAADGQMEGVPVALMEAMAAGRAVVASALSGIPELVRDGVSGILVPPGDAPALATASASLLADPGRARALGAAGRRAVAAHFNLRECVSQLLDSLAAHSRRVDLPPATALAAAGIAGAAGLDGHVLGVRRTHDRPESGVVELLASDGECARALVLKVQKPAPAGPCHAESARREFDALVRLHPLFARGEAGFGVPEPLHLDAARAAVLMETCAGEPLDQLLRRRRIRPDAAGRAALASALQRSGRWLRLFQEHTPSRAPAAAALDALVDRARADLAGGAAVALRPALLRRVRERIEDLAREGRQRGSPVVGRHGDFWPGNVHVSDASVQVIDFEGVGEGLPCEDAAYFLVQLDLFFSYPFLRAERERLHAAFLAGFAGDAGPDRLFLPLCRLAQAVRLLGEPAPPATRGLFRRWHRRHVLRAVLREELAA